VLGNFKPGKEGRPPGRPSFFVISVISAMFLIYSRSFSCVNYWNGSCANLEHCL